MQIDIERVSGHIARLSGEPRPAGSQALDAARDYVSIQFQEVGWDVTGSPFTAADDSGVMLDGINLIARLSKRSANDRPRLCVGAHLDSRPDSPGADDNASAVAVLLEMARLLPNALPDDAPLELELVAFDLEENGMLGGAVHAREMKEQGIDLRGMVSLEMLGYCDPTPGSQSLPRSLVGLYPETGDFIAVIGNQISGTLIAQFEEGLRSVPDLPVETLQVPSNGNELQATRLSDHSPFWDAGYPAVMITDTSFMRNPYYHTPHDMPDTLDYEFLERVARGSLEAVRRIIDGQTPSI